MFREPANIFRIPPPRFLDYALGQPIQRLLEKLPVHIAAADHIAQPKHQK
jgi:hypothetical protein